MAIEIRGQAAVLKAFDEALDEASEALEAGRPMALADFWRAVKAVLRLKPLRVADGRRNVVHVLSAPEARQWVLPVVFVCGMVEKQFPQFHRQDPFFPDAARCRLNDAGIRVRTAAEFEREERALFDSAISRATLLALLSYPEFDGRGDRNLPSLFLEELQLVPEEARAVRLRPAANSAAAQDAGDSGAGLAGVSARKIGAAIAHPDRDVPAMPVPVFQRAHAAAERARRRSRRSGWIS